MNRRTFLNNSAKVIGGSAALGTDALSYSRIVGANDRISVGHIGIGHRGTELDEIVSRLKQSHNVQVTAVCDLWSVNREKAQAANAAFYGKAPRAFKYLEDLLALHDLDAAIISTPEHSHSPILKLAAEAGKKAAELSGAAGGPAGGGSASTAFNQGVILWNASKFSEAKAQFEQAVKMDPNMADAHYWLGMATVNEGKTAEAKPHFEAYLKLAPTGQYAEMAKNVLASIK